MENSHSVGLGHIIEEFKLEVLRRAPGYEMAPISIEEVNRPGLQIAGYFNYFDPRRLQLIGLVEHSYLSDLSEEKRREVFEKLLSYPIPALIFTRALPCFPECMEMAQKYDRTILRTGETTSAFMSSLIAFLRNSLAPRITRHGVLVEVYGEGVLLLGESGVGKSETAIELVKRGHRLIADDAVDIRLSSENKLIGSAPELIRHYIELRGIGVVDVCRLFGMGAVKKEQEINLIVNLEIWQENAVYDRLGAENLYTRVLGVDLPCLTIPVKPGRNLAIVIEVAAMSARNKKMGHNAALELTRQINEHFDQALGKQAQQANG